MEGTHCNMLPVVRKLQVVILNNTLNEWCEMKISCYLTSTLFINNYFWPEHVIPWACKENYCSHFYSPTCLGIATCLQSYYVCSLCTGIDIATLKYLARCSVLNSIFDWVVQPQFSYLLLLDWFSFVRLGTCRPSCSSSLLAAYKRNEIGKLMTF